MRARSIFLALGLAACGGSPKTASEGPVGGTGDAAGDGDPQAPAPKVKTEAAQLLKEAAAARAKGDLSGAESALKDAIEEDPTFIQAYFNLGVLYEEQGDREKAKEWYKRTTEKDAKFGDALVNLGNIYLAEGRRNEAIAAFQQAVQVEPFNGEAHLNLAIFAKESKDFATAVKHVRTALKENSQSVAAYDVLARVYYDLGKYELAQLVCLNALEIDPKAASIHNLQGLVYLKLDDVTRALASFQRATEADSRFVPALMNLGAITFNYRDYESSYRAFDAVLKVEPKNVDALLSRAVAARGMQRFDEAEKGYKEVVTLDAKHAGAFYNLGILYQEHMNKLEDALASFESVLRFESQDADLRKDVTQRIQEVRIQIQALKENEKMMKEQGAQPAAPSGGEQPPAAEGGGA